MTAPEPGQHIFHPEPSPDVPTGQPTPPPDHEAYPDTPDRSSPVPFPTTHPQLWLTTTHHHPQNGTKVTTQATLPLALRFGPYGLTEILDTTARWFPLSHPDNPDPGLPPDAPDPDPNAAYTTYELMTETQFESAAKSRHPRPATKP